jgi:hypothetical protein
VRCAGGRLGWIVAARIGAAGAGVGIVAGAAGTAHAGPLAAIAPAATDDARRAIVVGTGGEVYEPDGKGAWVHRLPSTTAEPVVAAGRAGEVVVAIGDGVVYRLAGNGWSAIRLVQHGKAILGAGRALAAVGRQVFVLDQLTKGEPTRLVTAPANVVAISAGAKAAIIATDAAAFRLETGGTKPGKLVALPGAPRHLRLVSDRWAITDRGALELPAGKLTRWPTGLAIGVAATTADEALVAIGSTHAGLELVTLRAGTLARDPLGVTLAPGVTAVGLVADRGGRAVVALSDGRLALRDKAGWTTTEVSDAAAAEHPGAGPASSP